MAAGVACGLQNRRGARVASRVGSTPTRSRHFLLLALLTPALIALPGDVCGQEPAVPDSAERVNGAPTDTVPTPSPLLETVAPEPADSIGPPVSPMGAFFRSLILPGWGQASVDQPVRGAFYFTMEAASLWMLLKTQAKLDAARRAGDDELAASRQEQKEDWIVLAVFWALFSGVDAWVSTHLWDFEGAVIPPPDGSPGVAVQYSIPVGGPQ
jgi:hypothetical protein